MDRIQYEVYVLQFGCHINHNGSCFAEQQSGELDAVTEAFVRAFLNCLAVIFTIVANSFLILY